MHRTRGHRPPAGGSRGTHRSLPTAQQRGCSIRLPAIPRVVHIGTRFLPQVAVAGSHQDTDNDLAELQPFLSPPTGIATRPSYQCA